MKDFLIKRGTAIVLALIGAIKKRVKKDAEKGKEADDRLVMIKEWIDVYDYYVKAKSDGLIDKKEILFLVKEIGEASIRTIEAFDKKAEIEIEK